MESPRQMMIFQVEKLNVKSRGFTLIELLLVILLVGSLLYISFPKFQDLTDVHLKSTSRKLSALIRYLYNESAFKKKIYKLVFDFETNEYWVEVLVGNEYIVDRDPVLRKKKLPIGLYFKDVITERNDIKTLNEKEEYILFLPTGFVEPAVIYLGTDDGEFYTIATKPYTGGTKVFDEYVEIIKTGNNQARQ